MTLKFLLMIFLWYSRQLVLCDLSLSWKYRIYFGSLLSSSLFKRPTDLWLHCLRISHISGSLGLVWTAIDRLSIIWKSNLTDKMKRSFFHAVVVSILLYGCTTWTLTKQLEKKLDSNYTRMLWAILNKSWQQHPTRHQLYGHMPPITKTIQARRTRHAGHCWRSKDELISDVLLWTPAYGQAKAGRPAWTYIQQLCKDTGCSPEDLPEVMNDREKWRERVRDIRASGMTWWWWWYLGYAAISRYLVFCTSDASYRHEVFEHLLCIPSKFLCHTGGLREWWHDTVHI